MRFIVVAIHPDLRSVSREWWDPAPLEGTSVSIAELRRELRADRVDGTTILSYSTPETVQELLDVPGTVWVDHKKYIDGEARRAA